MRWKSVQNCCCKELRLDLTIVSIGQTWPSITKPSKCGPNSVNAYMYLLMDFIPLQSI